MQDVQVVKLIYISPATVPENFKLHLVASWNLVGFQITEGTISNKLFAGTTFKMSYWNAPFGPCSEAPNNAPVELGVGDWVKVNQNTTATVPL